LWLFTDPVRTPDPLAVARRLPPGAVVVHRTFGAADAETAAVALRQLTWARGLLLLIGADHRLAARVGADGVHLPERLSHRVVAIRRGRPGWLISVAAHDEAAIRRGQAADALVVSAVFPSRSPSAGPALGPTRFAALVRASRKPVIALGGINNKNAPRLISTGAAGIAAVEGLMAR
jgi:thiamine-phosphate pyrophosphorylase